MKIDKDIASKMRQRITFQSESTSSDSGGGSTLSWVSGDSVWAYIRPLSSRSISAERVFAGQIEDRVIHLVTTRYLSGITPKMRILYGSRVFNIKSVVNVNEASELLQITAEEGSGV